MIWPPPNDFRDAVRNPAASFRDPDLAASDAVVGANGLPDAHPGNASRVYQLCAEDGRSWAVKCFSRIDDAREARYAAVRAALAGKPYAVDFDYQTEGALIAGRRWPVLKMDWVEGQTLQQVAKERANSPAVMDGLFKRWVQLSRELRTAGVAHGDLQHANVLLVPGKWPGSYTLKLIDYDAMYLPELANAPTYETGNPNYQHPERNERSYSPDLDRFPLLVVATALRALAVRGPDLWGAYAVRDGLLFAAADFRAPASSRVLRKLWKSADPTLHALVGKLALACGQPLARTPWLDDLCANGAPALSADEERAVDATLRAAATAGTVTLDDDDLIPAEVVAFTLDDEPEPVAPKPRPALKPLPLPPEPEPAARPKPLTPVPVVTGEADEDEEEPRPRRKPRREPAARGFPWIAVAVVLGFMMVAGAIVAGWLVARAEKPAESAQVQPPPNDTPKPPPNPPTPAPTPAPAPAPAPTPVLPNPDPVPPKPAPEPIPDRVRPDVAIPPPLVPGPPPFPLGPPPPFPPNGLPAAPALAVVWKGVAAAPMANALPQAPLFTADGKTLVLSGGTSGTVLTFDAKTGRAGAVFDGHKGPGGVHWLATVGSDRVVSGGFDAKQTTWDIKTGRPVDAVTFPELPPLPPGAAGHAGITYGVSPGGRYTVLARREARGGAAVAPGPLRVLDTATGKEVLSGEWNGGRVVFAADESRVLVLNGLGKAVWYKLPSGEADGGWEVGARADQARVLGASADGGRVLYHGALAGQPAGVFLLEGRTGRVVRKLNNAAPYQAHVSAVSPDGRHVAVALIDFARNGQWHVDVFEADGWRLAGRASSPDGGGIREVPQFAFAPDGRGLSVLFPATKELLMFGPPDR